MGIWREMFGGWGDTLEFAGGLLATYPAAVIGATSMAYDVLVDGDSIGTAFAARLDEFDDRISKVGGSCREFGENHDAELTRAATFCGRTITNVVIGDIVRDALPHPHPHHGGASA